MMGIVNAILEGLGNVAKAALDLLSIFSVQRYLTTYSIDNQYLRWLNWLIPVSQMIVVLEAWLLAIALWYAASIALRWFKMIQ